MERKLYERFNAIHNELQCNVNGVLKKLSLSDVHASCRIAQELLQNREARTFIKSVADYFKAHGFAVALAGDGVNYIIKVA